MPLGSHVRDLRLVSMNTMRQITDAARSSLGKIFGDLIERVRFAKTLRWREMDSNYRSPV
jgi:hypothetical protein